MSKFRHTFLTKIRYRTKNKNCVDLSLLGIINRLLPLLPFSPVLVVDFDEETKKILRYRIAKKWW